MKRFTALGLTACALLILVGSIAFASGSSESTSSSSSKPVNLVIWGGVPVANGPQNYVDAWNKANPGIQISYTRFVNDDTGNTKLDTALLSGEQIDLYYTYSVPLQVKRIEGGMAEDLTQYGAADFVAKNIGTTGVFNYNGKYYSIPTTKEPNYIMLNKSLVDKAGLTVPTSWNMDDYRAFMQKLTQSVNGKTAYGINMYLDFARISLGDNYWYKNNGTESNFDNPAFRASYQLYVDMLMKDKSAFPYTEIVARKLQSYPQDLFLNQETAGMISAPWQLRYVRDTKQYPHTWVTTFAPLPHTATGAYNIGSLNNWLLINAKSNYKQQDWKVLQWIETDGSKYMIPAGKIPSWKQANPQDVVDGILGPEANTLFDVQAFKNVAFNPDTKYVIDSTTVAAPEINQIVNEEQDKLFLGGITTDQFISELKSRADAAIKAASK